MSHKIPRYAFPLTLGSQTLSHGMTLRDYMAAHAMTGLIAARGMLTVKELAVRAYEMADAMLDARCHEEVTERVGSDHG